MDVLEKELNAERAWKHYIENNELPSGIPPNPDEIYANEWKGWSDFVGWIGIEMN